MKPTTSEQALACALYSGDIDHPYDPDCGCALCFVASREAERLNEKLTELGWLLRPAVSLPREAPRGREGKLDLTDVTEAVLVVLLVEPLSTYEVNEAYSWRSKQMGWPERAWDTPRKRLSELERAGFVRQVTDDGKQILRQHDGISYGVWEITDKGREAVSRDAQASGRAAA